MTFQEVKYAPNTFKYPSHNKYVFYTAGLCIIPGWLMAGHLVMGLFTGFVGLFVGHFVFLIAVWSNNQTTFSMAKKYFIEQGYQAEFELPNQLLVDSHARKIAFVDNYKGTYDFYDLDDILKWEHTWVDSTNTSTNVWGDKVNSKTTQKNNILTIKTNNPHKPMYKISIPQHHQAQLWQARLSALVNGR
jgi:hypothetical protein